MNVTQNIIALTQDEPWGVTTCDLLPTKPLNEFKHVSVESKIQIYEDICDHPPRLSPFVGKLSFALQVKIGYNLLWLTMVLDKL